MKLDGQKRQVKILLGILFAIFAVAFFIAKQYWPSLLSLCLLLVVFKLEDLKSLIFSPNSGLQAEFQIPEENIKRDIKENNEVVTKRTFMSFKKVEEQIITDVHRELGGELKRTIHFMYGRPDKPEFMYTPDATIRTDNALIFLEVKYVLKPEFANRIVNNALRYLKPILEKFTPSAGTRLVIKLILASSYELNINSFNVPKGIELVFYKL